jgi:hypothetical protein
MCAHKTYLDGLPSSDIVSGRQKPLVELWKELKDKNICYMILKQHSYITNIVGFLCYVIYA